MEEEHGQLEVDLGYAVPAMGENVRVEYQEGRFDPGFGDDVLVDVGAVEAGADAPLQVLHDDLVEVPVFVFPELLKGSGVMFLEVVEHEGVRILQHFLQGFQRQEDLVNGISSRFAEITAFHFVSLYLLFDHRGYHIVLIGEKLVDRLFGNAQLRCYLVHGNRPDTVATEQIGCLYQYAFFNFHWDNKTTETINVTKVSMVFFII